MNPTAVKWRGVAVLVLALAPVVFLAGVGSYHLFSTGWSVVSYWPMALCWLGAYGLGWYSLKQFRRRPPDPVTTPNYWTDRDRAAWQVVEAAAQSAPPPTQDQLGDLARYAVQAQSLALEVAKVYRPTAADPFAHFTMPEVLACGELVAHDLAQTVNRFVPGSHILSLGDFRRLQGAAARASEWYPRLRNVYWLGAAVLNPVSVGLQVMLTKGAMAPASRQFQENVILWFQTVYLRQLGRYLIELNSGRLKVGAARYRELMALHKVPDPLAEPENEVVPASGGRESPESGAGSGAETRGVDTPRSPGPETLPVTIAVVGPVKAGKSSLVNALLGEQRAATDVLPLTAGLVRYNLRRAGLPPVTLIDTLGFGNAGPTEDDVTTAVAAVNEADLVLLVVPARSAARKPEAEFLRRVRAGVEATPDRKMPPVVVALSHVDLLTPAMEWSPPYDWRDGSRPKEQSMRDAAGAAREQFGGAEVVPVCTVPGKETGVRDELVAAVVSRLGEARGVGLLRALSAEANADAARKLFRQVAAAGSQAARVLWDAWRK